jgi:hypothetical protein
MVMEDFTFKNNMSDSNWVISLLLLLSASWLWATSTLIVDKDSYALHVGFVGLISR